jgi:acyl-CoA synthetase (AMP-forming)/AMP-acid ligase II
MSSAQSRSGACSVRDGLHGAGTVTQRLVSGRHDGSRRPALVPRVPLPPYSLSDLVSTVLRAAAGLAWRGVRPSDVVGVYVPDVACYVLACHAIRAAGGIPSPVSPELSVSEIAEQLADCRARMLLTAPQFAGAAVAAADRSWVRQVISFGEAAAATTFYSLLRMGSMPPPNERPHDIAMLPYQRRADGSLHSEGLTHLDLAGDLSALTAAGSITANDVVLATPPAGNGRPYTSLVDYALLQGATVVATEPAELDIAAVAYRATAAIVPQGVRVAAVPELRLLTVVS